MSVLCATYTVTCAPGFVRLITCIDIRAVCHYIFGKGCVVTSSEDKDNLTGLQFLRTMARHGALTVSGFTLWNLYSSCNDLLKEYLIVVHMWKWHAARTAKEARQGALGSFQTVRGGCDPVQ